MTPANLFSGEPPAQRELGGIRGRHRLAGVCRPTYTGRSAAATAGVGSFTATRKTRATSAMKAAISPNADAYESEAISTPARIGPAASPQSQIVPNTPIADPIRPALTRSATRAVVEGVTMATPSPKSAEARKRNQTEVSAGTAGSLRAHTNRPAKIMGFRPTRSESQPASGLATMVVASWAPRTRLIWASLSPIP